MKESKTKEVVFFDILKYQNCKIMGTLTIRKFLKYENDLELPLPDLDEILKNHLSIAVWRIILDCLDMLKQERLKILE